MLNQERVHVLPQDSIKIAKRRRMPKEQAKKKKKRKMCFLIIFKPSACHSLPECPHGTSIQPQENSPASTNTNEVHPPARLQALPSRARQALADRIAAMSESRNVTYPSFTAWGKVEVDQQPSKN